MSKQSKIKSRRKFISPVFHLQSEEEDEKHITKDLIKSVRKLGQLNLSSKHLSSVPQNIFSIYESKDETEVNLHFDKVSKDDVPWWNFKPLTHLDLSSNILTNIPGQIAMFEDLLVLNLQDNHLNELPPEIAYLTKLTKLILNHNKISKLPNELYRLTELKQFSINNNCLDSILQDIGNLVMLEKLDIANNCLTKLPPGIGFLVRLREVNVSNNKLENLPPDIVNLRNLLKLDLSHNNIKHLPDMTELRKLQILYAQHNNIEEIPNFHGCEQVEEIYFGNNFLKEVPLDFCENMFHLKILELRDNQIVLIPKEITNMAHLSKLDVTNNDITDLPNVMGLMPHLQTLKLEGNKLKHMRSDILQSGTNRVLKHLRDKINEEEMGTINELQSDVSYDCKIFPDRYAMKNGNILNLAMKNISHVPEECFLEAKEAKVSIVDLCKNKFSTVPIGLIHISTYLTELNLSGNQLKEVPQFFTDFVKLKFCDLSKNFIYSLPDSFGSMTFLREFVLSNNRFTNIPDCIFHMVGLEILLINDNCIEEINIARLKNLKRLAVLDLSNNNISYVPPELGNMIHLRSLEIKGNPFRQPRYAILEQGTECLLSYLRNKLPL